MNRFITPLLLFLFPLTASAQTFRLKDKTATTTLASDDKIYLDGLTNGVRAYDPTANVRSLLGAADYSAMRTQLSLVPGTNVVAYGGALGTPSSGVGTNLTLLNASNLGSGTVPPARLSFTTAEFDTMLSDGNLSSTYLPLAGGTLTGAIAVGGAPNLYPPADAQEGIGVVSTTATPLSLNTSHYGATGGPVMHFYRARGSTASPTAPQSGDNIMSIGARALVSGTFAGSSLAIQGYLTENSTTNYSGAYLQFDTTATGSNVRSARMTIGQNGNVGLGVAAVASPPNMLSLSGNIQLMSDSATGINFTGANGTVDDMTNYYDRAATTLHWRDNAGLANRMSLTQAGALSVPGAVATGDITSTGTLKLASDSGTGISFTGANGTVDDLTMYYDRSTSTLYVRDNAGLANRLSLTQAGALTVPGAISSSATIKPGGYTVATLPAGSVGMHAYVTDATTPTYLGALVGGGAVTCPVFYNGTAWVSH